MKNKKGITLIALIITIIVLLILAGVSISIIVGDNGIVKQAQTAKDKTDLANAQSAIETAVATLQTEYMSKKTTNVNADIADVFTYKKLNEELGNLNYQLANGENGTDSIFDSGEEENKKNTSGAQFITQIKSKKAGDTDLYNVVLLKKSKSLVIVGDNLKLADSQINSKSVNIGDDYRYYKDNSKYSVTLNGKTIDEWKVFLTDENGAFLIISDYLPVECLESNKDGDGTIASKVGLTTGGIGKYNAYWETTPIMNDVDSIFLLKYHNKYNLNSGNANSICVSTLLNKDNWKDFVVQSSGATYAIGAPTLEMWINSWNLSTENDINKAVLSCQGGENGYSMKFDSVTGKVTNIGDDTYGKDFDSGNMRKTDEYKMAERVLYYPRKGEASDTNECIGYWLAAPSNNSKVHICRPVESGGIGINGGNYPRFALRPLVYIEY